MVVAVEAIEDKRKNKLDVRDNKVVSVDYNTFKRLVIKELHNYGSYVRDYQHLDSNVINLNKYNDFKNHNFSLNIISRTDKKFMPFNHDYKSCVSIDKDLNGCDILLSVFNKLANNDLYIVELQDGAKKYAVVYHGTTAVADQLSLSLTFEQASIIIEKGSKLPEGKLTVKVITQLITESSDSQKTPVFDVLATRDTGAQCDVIGRKYIPEGCEMVQLLTPIVLTSPLSDHFKLKCTEMAKFYVQHDFDSSKWIEVRALVVEDMVGLYISGYTLSRLGHNLHTLFYNPLRKEEFIMTEDFHKSRFSDLEVINSLQSEVDLSVFDEVIARNVDNEKTLIPKHIEEYKFNWVKDAPSQFWREPYKINPKYYTQVGQQIQDLVDAGVVVKLRRSKKNTKKGEIKNSLPLVVVRRMVELADHTIKEKVRVCVDTTMVNKYLRPPSNEFSMDTESIIRNASDHKVFSVLDITAAFHSCRISEEVSEVMTFRFGDEWYRYVRGPFGLSDFPYYFNFVMNQVLGDLSDFCSFYVDDIVIFSDSWEDHQRHVKMVINRLTDNNLHISPDKCQWAVTEAKLLGWIIKAGGKIKADPKKIKMLQDLPRPKLIKELLGFIGSCSYLRKCFRGDWARYQASLNKIIAAAKLKNKKSVKWTKKANAAFEAAKLRLQEQIELSVMPADASRVIYCDANDDAWGAAVGYLMKDEQNNNMFVPVDVAQGVFSGYETRYLSVKKELLAIVRSIQKFNLYLGAKHFTVYSDCKSLDDLHIKRTMDRTMASWLGHLLEYNFSVVWCEGTVGNWLVDALSRSYIEKTKKLRDDDSDSDSDSVSGDADPSIIDLDTRDGSVTRIIGAIDMVPNANFDFMEDALVDEAISTLVTKYGKNRDITDSDEANRGEVPSEEEKLQLLTWAHDSVGHASKEFMVNWLIDHKVFWSGIHRDATKLMANCLHCLQHNAGRKRYHLAKGFNAVGPFHQVQVDLIGPLGLTPDGNRHIVVLVDVATGFVLLEAVKDTSTDSIVRVLRDWFYDFGHPKILRTDQASGFTAEMMKKFIESVNVEHSTTAAYTPQQLGIVERYNGSISSILRKLQSSLGIQWDLLLKRVQWILNTRIDPHTKRDSFQLMFGRNEIDLADYSETQDKFDLANWEKHITYAKKILLDDYINIRAGRRKTQSDRLNKSRLISDFIPVGTPVLFSKPRKDKEQPYWHGIYIIDKVDSKGNYYLKTSLGSMLKRKFAREQLKIAGDDIAALSSVERIVDAAFPNKDGITKVRMGDHHVQFDEPMYQVMWVGEEGAYPEDWYSAKQLNSSGFSGHIKQFMDARKIFKRGYDPIYKLMTREEE